MKNIELNDIKMHKITDFVKDNIYNVIYSIIIIIIFYAIAVMVRHHYLSKIVDELTNNKLLFILIGHFLFYTLILVGIIFALTINGFNLSSIFIFLGSIGFAIALAIQSTLTEMVGGLFIIFYQLFDKNDKISSNDIKGEVKDFNLLKTTIVNFDGVQTVVSNSTFINNPIINYTKTPTILHKINVTISSNNNIDYNILMSNIKNKIKNESKYCIDDNKIIVNIDEIESAGTKIAIHTPIMSKNMTHADMELKLIIRNVMSDDNVLLYDSSYIDKDRNNLKYEMS